MFCASPKKTKQLVDCVKNIGTLEQVNIENTFPIHLVFLNFKHFTVHYFKPLNASMDNIIYLQFSIVKS